MPLTAGDSDVFLQIARDRRLFDSDQLEPLVEVSSANGEYSEREAIRRGLFSKQEYLRVLENYYFYPSIDLTDLRPDPKALMRIPERVARRCQVLPIMYKGDVLVVAFAKPDDEKAIQEVKSRAKGKVEIRVAPQTDLHDLLEKAYGDLSAQLKPAPSPDQKKPIPLAEEKDEGSVREILPELAKIPPGEGAAVQVVEELFQGALKYNATDIHVEPARESLVLRLRIDGMMQPAARIPREMTPSVVSRFKVLGGMDIAEKRIPQDGRYSFDFKDEVVDCRISSLPSKWGEKIVARLLRKDMSLLNLEKIEMPAPMLERWRNLLKLPFGMMLVTGPTGSGKTTTLYATIASLDHASTNIVTLEDPIEYEMSGVTQVQINAKAGMTFQAGLRSILRQDPDTVLVGEIRDTETVEIACRAALTGHKIFSTLHTNDSASSITRLLDMGVPPYLLTASLKAVLAQRLLRTLCPHCAEPYKPSETELARLGYPKIDSLKRAVGCSDCGFTGYKGRQAVFELLVVDESLHRYIIDRSSAYTIRHHAMAGGMVPLGDVTRSLVISGKTSLAEGERVVFSEEAKEQLCPNCEHVVSLEFAVCPFCQQVLKESCSNCGNPVETSWDACPNCGHEIDREWKKVVCSNCLAVLESDWPSCPYCGEER